MAKISAEDVNAIAHINYVANTLHDSVDDLYEDLMDGENETAKNSKHKRCVVYVQT